MAVTHTIKDRDGNLVEIKGYRKAIAIRKFCMECLGYSWAEVQRCTAPLCPLFPFRLGNEKGLLPENVEHLESDYVEPTEEDEEDAYMDSLEEEENENV